MMAGARSVQLVSALLKNGPQHLTKLRAWISESTTILPTNSPADKRRETAPRISRRRRAFHATHCARFGAGSGTGLRRAGGPFRLGGRIDLPPSPARVAICCRT